MTRFWPSKDAHEPPRAQKCCGDESCPGCVEWLQAQRAALPPDHQFTRPCPWCGRPLEKKHAGDQFQCRTCGWRG
jgi:hypothetical protein